MMGKLLCWLGFHNLVWECVLDNYTIEKHCGRCDRSY